MKPKILLRIASVLMLLHAAGHTMGSLTWKDHPDPAVAKVVEGMISQHFVFMGRESTIAMFYSGYGVILIFVLLMLTALLWIAGDHAINQPLTKKLCLVLSVFLLLMGITEWVYFFPLAAAFSLLASILTGIAMIRINKINYAL
ncbi:MAG: LIC_13387 family protein [Mucilaginibacter sp.]